MIHAPDVLQSASSLGMQTPEAAAWFLSLEVPVMERES
jgi:hypothetical protein